VANAFCHASIMANGLPGICVAAGAAPGIVIGGITVARRANCWATIGSAAKADSWSCHKSSSFFARSAGSIVGLLSVMPAS